MITQNMIKTSAVQLHDVTYIDFLSVNFPILSGVDICVTKVTMIHGHMLFVQKSRITSVAGSGRANSGTARNATCSNLFSNSPARLAHMWSAAQNSALLSKPCVYACPMHVACTGHCTKPRCPKLWC